MGHSYQHSSERPQSRKVLRFQGPPARSRVRGELEFRNVSSQVTESGHSALSGVSFCARAGARVAIVGPSGSGKMNLLNLLTRFHTPSGGAVLLDGRELREYELTELRSQFSIVPREPVLWAASVADNIGFAAPEASQADVIRAARLANAHEFIEDLPQDYDTMLGECGAELSPGQRQRLAIARAFLKDAPIVIMDEPPVTQDLRSEQFIVEAVDRLIAGRTSFAIAHRISTLECCDLVLVLKNGSLDALCTGGDYAKAPRLPRRASTSVPRSIDMLTPGPVLVRMEP